MSGEAAGMQAPQDVTDEALLHDLRRVLAEYGGATRELYRRYGRYACRILLRRLAPTGAWVEVLAAAGLPHPRRRVCPPRARDERTDDGSPSCQQARQWRRCLGCDGGFLSEGCHHRLCERCRQGWRERGEEARGCLRLPGPAALSEDW